VPAQVALYAAVTMAITISFTGGRPAMISAATGAVALVLAPLSIEHGVDHLVAAVILGGVFQVLLGLARVGQLMRFIPRSVMVGFVNALGVLLIWEQRHYFLGVPWVAYAVGAAAIALLLLTPRLTRAVPAPLVAIVVLTGLTWASGADVDTVTEPGERLVDGLPSLLLPDVPLTFETLRLVAPYALAMALVGLLESLMTAKLVDDITDTHSDKNREARGQGIANLVTGLLGGMGGCAMIGQTLTNVRQSGARTRVSTFMAGLILLVLVVALGDVVGHIPFVVLGAIMVMVGVGSIDWHSLRTLPRMPKSETTVMLTTVVATLATRNLAVGVISGVVVATLLFARRVAHLAYVERELVEVDGVPQARYRVSGALFFASSNDLYSQFHYGEDPEHVVVDMSASHIWDASTVAALDSVVAKYAQKGVAVEITGLNRASAELHGRLTGLLG